MARSIDLINSKPATIIPGSHQGECEYDVDDNLIYLGYSPREKATSAATWTVIKYTYDASGNIIRWKTGFGSWDDRVNINYQ